MTKSLKIRMSLKHQYFEKRPTLGMYTRWDSYIPNRYKQNLFWTLLHRGYSICNGSQLRKKEFLKISTLLEKIGFPLNYINRQIQHFLANKQSKKPKSDEKDDTKRSFMKLPYMKKMNGLIPKKINASLKKLDFKITFVVINETFNLKRPFTYKERQNKLHRSSQAGSSFSWAWSSMVVRGLFFILFVVLKTST